MKRENGHLRQQIVGTNVPRTKVPECLHAGKLTLFVYFRGDKGILNSVECIPCSMIKSLRGSSCL